MNEISTKNKLFCYNCHEFCHVSEDCPKVFKSFGIICYYVDKGKKGRREKDNERKKRKKWEGLEKIKYLLVKRKYSFAFVEFMRGRYNLMDRKYITTLFNKMTLFERCILINNDFKKLWNKLWSKNTKFKKSNSNIFNKASVKYYILKNGFILQKDNSLCKMSEIMKDCTNNYKSSEWYFPKGRRNINENSIQSALREFEEETNIKKECININTDMGEFIETHVSYNNREYRAYFYVAKLESDINDLNLFERNSYQKNEIGYIDWFSYDECIKKFRKYENEKLKLMHTVHKYIETKEEVYKK